MWSCDAKTDGEEGEGGDETHALPLVPTKTWPKTNQGGDETHALPLAPTKTWPKTNQEQNSPPSVGSVSQV